jgi:hypothetical protein
MHRLPDNGIVVGIYGGIGYYERNSARKSADFFTRLRSWLGRIVAML